MNAVNRTGLPSDEVAGITRLLSEHRTLSDVLEWASKQPAGTVLPQIVADVIVQDEFTHDVIVPWRDGLTIVYGTT
jgi:hypothetical protein